EAQTILGAGSSTYGLAIDSQGDIVVGSDEPTIARLDPNGNLLWTASVPNSEWFDRGYFLGLALAPNGDAVLQLRGHTPIENTGYMTVARFDAAGQYLWSQSVRYAEPNVDVRGTEMAIA